jgi:hypothetical protein
MRRRLADPREAAGFEVLESLRAEGATDYLASPLHFTDGTVHVATWATRDPDGFTEEQIAGIEAVVAPLARVAEVRALLRTTRTLLDTYVGSHAGERILAGKIRRGDTEAIQAAIWLSDMRGFTALADRVSPQTLITLLNRYFDCQVPAILEHGGEVLKFMGDGLLAIFPLRTGHDVERVCGDALAAARDARSRLAALAAKRRPRRDRVRLGLYCMWRVPYGNIGGGNRPTSPASARGQSRGASRSSPARGRSVTVRANSPRTARRAACELKAVASSRSSRIPRPGADRVSACRRGLAGPSISPDAHRGPRPTALAANGHEAERIHRDRTSSPVRVIVDQDPGRPPPFQAREADSVADAGRSRALWSRVIWPPCRRWRCRC